MGFGRGSAPRPGAGRRRGLQIVQQLPEQAAHLPCQHPVRPHLARRRGLADPQHRRSMRRASRRQGVGQALTEKTIYDPDSGQLMSGSLMDYALPRADVVPHVHFDMHNSLCTTNPLGVKGAGEAGAIGAPPLALCSCSSHSIASSSS